MFNFIKKTLLEYLIISYIHILSSPKMKKPPGYLLWGLYSAFIKITNALPGTLAGWTIKSFIKSIYTATIATNTFFCSFTNYANPVSSIYCLHFFSFLNVNVPLKTKALFEKRANLENSIYYL